MSLSARLIKTRNQDSTKSLDNVLIFMPYSEGVRFDNVMVRRWRRQAAELVEEENSNQAVVR